MTLMTKVAHKKTWVCPGTSEEGVVVNLEHIVVM